MGRTKQLLPWRDGAGETTLIAAAFDCLAGHCDRMIVVVGHDGRSIVDALGKRAFETVQSDADAPMFESIRAGLSAAVRQDGVKVVFLHPADHPKVEAATMQLLIEAQRTNPQAAIMPEYDGKGGHPVLIPINLAEAIEAYDGEGGLRAFWEMHPDTAIRVAVDDAWVVADVDTPEAYERFRA